MNTFRIKWPNGSEEEVTTEHDRDGLINSMWGDKFDHFEFAGGELLHLGEAKVKELVQEAETSVKARFDKALAKVKSLLDKAETTKTETAKKSSKSKN